MDRDRELAQLKTCLDDALAGQARLALVEGPAGIGKSRLLTEMRRLGTAAGAVTLTGRSSQLEQEFGFGLVRQLFEPVLADPKRRRRLLVGAAHSAAAVFDVGGFDRPDGDPSGDRGSDGLFGVLHGLYWLTANLAEEQPLLLAIDDLQWCDIASLQFLTFLERRLEGMPVLVVGTVRTGELADPEGLLAELAHGLAAVSIRPEPLTLEGVGDLVRSRLGEHADDAFVAACRRTTGGNPLLLRQLLRGLETDRVRPDASHADTVTAIGSRAISSMVLMRLGRLPNAATVTARAIAVLGDEAELPAVAKLAGLTEGQAAAAVAGLVRAEVLRDDYPLGFVHALVRDAVYRELPAGERELRHEEAARILDAVGAAPEQVAAHLLQAPRRGDPWTVDVLTRAATRSADRGAADSAASYLRRALAEPPAARERGGLLLQLGWLESMANGPRARRAPERGLPGPGRRPGRARPRRRHAGPHPGLRGRPWGGGPVRPRGVGGPPGHIGGRASGTVGAGADQRVHARPRRPDLATRATTRTSSAVVRVRGCWPPSWPGTCSSGLRTASGASSCARFALEGEVLRRVDTGLLWVVAAIVLDLADESVGDFWQETLADAHARGSMFAALSTHLWLGYRQWRAGDLPEALQSLSASNEQSERWGNPRIGVPYGEAFITGVLLDRGDVAAAQGVPRLAPASCPASVTVPGCSSRPGPSCCWRRDATTRRSPGWTRSGHCSPAWSTRHGGPGARCGRRPWPGSASSQTAVALVEEELEVARSWDAPSQVGRTLRLLGQLRGDARRGRPARGRRPARGHVRPVGARARRCTRSAPCLKCPPRSRSGCCARRSSWPTCAGPPTSGGTSRRLWPRPGWRSPRSPAAH